MKTIVHAIDKVLIPVLGALMAGLVIVVTWQVFSRYLLRAPSSYTEEIARFMLIWIGLLGAAYTYRTKMHLGLDLFTAKLTGAARMWAELFSALCVAGFAVIVMILGGVQLVSLIWELKQSSAALGIQVAFIYSVIPLTGAIITLYAVDAALDSIAQHKQQQEK
ncbi:MAG TPA: TRAP transporter small permease [Gammaproteobacteria bacterium]